MYPSISNPNDPQNWQLMTAIKSSILRRMDSAAPGVRICCVKFIQQVVLVQSPGVVDPRVNTTPFSTYIQSSHVLQRPNPNDISLTLVPRDHPLVPYVALEAEGHGLLDRLLDIIHGDHRLDTQSWNTRISLMCDSDGLLVTATLNSLGMLIHRRPVLANKILGSVLNFNPLKLANSPMTPKNKVIIKSIERTVRALLMNIMKRYEFILYLKELLLNFVSLGTQKIQSMGGYSNFSSACIVRVLRFLKHLIASDQHPLSQLTAWIKQRDSGWVPLLSVARLLCRRSHQAQ